MKNAIESNILDIDYIDENGYTAIHVAANHGQHDCLQVLLNFGLNVMHLTIFHAEWRHHQTNLVITALINTGIDINIQEGFTPLHYAAERKCFDCIKFLLKNGADCRIKNKLNETPLNLMERDINQECRRLLVEAESLFEKRRL